MQLTRSVGEAEPPRCGLEGAERERDGGRRGGIRMSLSYPEAPDKCVCGNRPPAIQFA